MNTTQPSSWVIEPMVAADLTAITAVETAAQETPWARQSFADCLDNSYYSCHVVRHQQAIVAFQVTSFIFDESHLLNIAVAPAFQRRGIAAALIEQLFDEARRHDTRSIFLEVRASNKGAQSLYERFGFVHYGDRPAYYRTANGHEDAWLMQRLF